MSLDLLDRLISDLVEVTQTLMNLDVVDLQAYQPGVASIEKDHGSKGVERKYAHKAKRPLHDGVHRTVC